VISQLTGACIRAALVILMIALPSLLLTEVTSEVKQMTALIALFATVFVLVEYLSIYPGLVEFRDAPPFNRVRFGMVFCTVLVLSLAARDMTDPTLLTRFFTAIGALMGVALDFPLSPIRAAMVLASDETSSALALRRAAGLGYLTALVTLSVFAILIRLRGWPLPAESFNIWINLPNFDPTRTTDVVKRLKRSARINILLGCLLPYLVPVVLQVFYAQFGIHLTGTGHALIWTTTLWAFLPTAYFMRGIAMLRLASMLAAKQARLAPEDGEFALSSGSPQLA